MTNTEKQQAYRERMYAAGYKQMRIWVSRTPESKGVKMERAAFVHKLDELTSGWSKAKVSRLFIELIKIVKAKAKEANRKK